MPKKSYLKYYDLEHYLFEDVSKRFEMEGEIDAFDFFCIIIWKANRAKSKIARRLLGKGFADLDSAVRVLIGELRNASSNKGRLGLLLLEWHFRLPMASAILTVLYPKEFTVYDVRVCGRLGSFQTLQNMSDFDATWTGYQAYVKAVQAAVPDDLTLRDKDRWLWGQSFSEQLTSDVARNFIPQDVRRA